MQNTLKSVSKKLLLTIDNSGNLLERVKRILYRQKNAVSTSPIPQIPADKYRLEQWFQSTGKVIDEPNNSFPKSILLVTNMVLNWKTLLPTYGGGERYLFELTKLLSLVGFNVTIAQPAEVEQQITSSYNGHQVLLFPLAEWQNGFLIGLNSQVAQIAHNYDRVIYFMPETTAPIVQKGSMVISHGIWFDHSNYPTAGYRTTNWCKLIKETFTAPAHCVSVDTNTINFIRCLWPSAAAKMHYLPNFFDKTIFYPEPSKRNPQRLTILFPRRAQINRGSELFGDILSLIPHDVTILWVGKGDEKGNEAVEKACANDPRCQFIGADFSEIAEYYKKADIAVIPTIACEGTSLSCIEALASGCAVVSTYVGGLSDLIIDGFNGIYVAPTAKDIAEGINKLIEDTELRKQLEKNALESCKTLERTVWQNKWVKLLNSINWIDDTAYSYWNRLQIPTSQPTSISAEKWIIVTRNAIHGGVESLIREEAIGLQADVIICGGLDNRESVPFLYRRADTPEELARILIDYDKILYHWLPDWAVETIAASGKKSVEFVHRSDTMDGDKRVPSALITHSEFLAKHVMEVTGRLCSVAPHPIPDVFFNMQTVNRNSVGALCGYYKTKGLDTLIRAWSILPSHLSKLPLEFYGEGSDQKKFENLAKKLGVNVTFNPPTVEPWSTLSQYRLIVMPSRVEGFPVSILEALAMNIPVICSNLPGMLDFNNLAETRIAQAPLITVPVDDPEALAIAIEKELTQTHSIQTSRYIQEYYSRSGHIEAIRRALQGL